MAIKTDLFTETSDTPLEDHSSDVGGGWGGADTADFDVIAADDEVNKSVGTPRSASGDENPTSADYWVEVNGKTISTGGLQHFGPSVRVADADNWYAFHIGGDGNWAVDKRVGGSFTFDLATGSKSGFSASTYYDLKLEIEGTTIKAYIDTVEVANFTDSSLSSAGQVGLYMRNTWPRITSLDSDYVAAGGALLDAAVSGSGTQSSSLTTSITAKAGVSCAATAAAVLTTAILLTAGVTASATQVSSLTTAVTMAATSSASATLAGELTTSIPLNASVSAAATQSSELTVLEVDLFNASVSASATAAGSLTTEIALNGSVNASAEAAPALTTAITMQGAVTATAAQASGLTTSITLGSAVNGSCTAVAELTALQQAFLDAAATGTATASAELTIGLPIYNVVSTTLYFTNMRVVNTAFTKTFREEARFTLKRGKEVWF